MQLLDGRPIYSATDLVGFLACSHLTDLERLAIAHRLEKPMRDDPELDAIAERGKEHEQAYLAGLVAAGRRVTSLDVPDEERPPDRATFYRDAAARTREAITRGDDVIFQACFFDGGWLGFADFLLRVDDPGAPLGWSYEVADTKLAHKVKASAVLQICVYNELLEAIQGRYPERLHVALGGRERETRTYRTADFTAYYRRAKALFLEAVATPLATGYGALTSYPEPVEHCGVCAWDMVCAGRRRRDDHLSLVAGITARTRAELVDRGTTTRRALAVLPVPLTPRLAHTSPESLLRVREQARIQVAGDAVAPQVLHELLDLARTRDGALDTTKGLLALPPPSPGDLFLDLEGDPFAGEDGIDYLFGVLQPGSRDADGKPLFHAFWSQAADGRVTPAAEKRAFEQTIDLIMRAWKADPDMHVYHYASYERTHLGTLMGRHATREDEVDRLFRGGRLVDLFGVVRQGLRASVESYSIKRMEPLYGYTRDVELRDAGSSIAEFERWLRLGGESGRDPETLLKIQRYNRDDVMSTWLLRDWLEGQRRALEDRLGAPLPRPALEDDAPREDLAEWLRRVKEVADPLLERVPQEEAERREDPAANGTWLLAHLLGWHRREEKPDWWRFFNQLRDMTHEERLEAREPLAMLELIGPDASDPDGRTFRYRFPEQDHDLGRDPVNTETGKSMAIKILDAEANEIVLRFKRGHDIVHPRSLVSTTVIPARAQEERLLDIGRHVLEEGMRGEGPHRAARDLLMRHPPRIAGHPQGTPLRRPGESASEAARRHVVHLDRSTLAIQGPPGSGKTYTGARMVLDLVAAGKRVGVTANSHKVIGKLLEDVWLAVRDDPEFAGRVVRIGQKPGDDGVPTCTWAEKMVDDRSLEALAAGEVDVVGGSAWLWAGDRTLGAVDVLFIDEAGQFSLANSVAVSTAADSLVLLGDPQQLDQPLKGTHPPGADRSALAHLLDGRAVMPPERGLFMDDTWRLHPEICAFTSEVFYEGRLLPQAGNEVQALAGRGPADGVGIRVMHVDHAASGNDNRSPEEAQAIGELVAELLDGGATWTDRDGRVAPIGPADILVITPYNAQRKLIGSELARRGGRCAAVPVGTVDKFQGQQAPISIYSMATSTPEDAPRGMEFLYSLNRLNVATSRARCLTLVVASPALVRARARTPRQIQLANALCRLIELASGGHEAGSQERLEIALDLDRQANAAFATGAGPVTARVLGPAPRPDDGQAH